MKDALRDLLKRSVNLFDQMIIDGTDQQTVIRAMSPTKNVIMMATMKAPIEELRGESALSNLGLLLGCLNFASYEAGTTEVVRRKDDTSVEHIRFLDPKGMGTTYRLKNPSIIRDEDRPPKAFEIPWALEFKPERAKLDEFEKLASLYGDVGKKFAPATRNGDLLFLLGEVGSSTHSGEMVFHEGASAEITGNIYYSVPDFKNLIKIAGGDSYVLRMNSRGVMMVSIASPYGDYDFILRAEK